MSVSVPQIHLVGKERVVAFEIRFTSAGIAQIPRVPIGWHVNVDNDLSWNTKIWGNVPVGAAAGFANFLRDFLVVEKDESLGLPFRVRGVVQVTEDYEKYRIIRLGMKDFVIKDVTATGL